jgi:hypothetical protein
VGRASIRSFARLRRRACRGRLLRQHGHGATLADAGPSLCYRIDGGAWAELDTARGSWYPNECYRVAGLVVATSPADGSHVITFRTRKGRSGVLRVYRLMMGRSLAQSRAATMRARRQRQ